MALDTRLKLVDQVLMRAGLDMKAGSTDRLLAEQWVNDALEFISLEHDWPELDTFAWLDTVDDYATGTVTFTQADATVVGVGTTFTSAMAGRKIAAGYNEPWFGIETFTDGTNLEMERAWAFATSAGSDYIIYEDVYSLDATVEKLYNKQVTLHSATGGFLRRLTQIDAMHQDDLPRGTGEPEGFFLVENDSSGNKQIQLGSKIPDDIYVIRYGFKKKHADMTTDNQSTVLRRSLMPIAIQHAMAFGAYELPRFRDSQLAERSERRFNAMLQNAISKQKSETPRGVRQKAFDEGVANFRYPFNQPVSAT